MIDMVDKMSNGVAVTTLKHIKYNIEKARKQDDSIDIFGCDRKALDMAIKALEQQPCEDCISLNKLDDIITKTIDKSENQAECQTLRWVLDVMSELPSVTPKQKVGKWEEIGIVMEGRMYEHGECDMQDAWGCDYCGYQVHMPTKYCPNCGVKMEVEDGSD